MRLSILDPKDLADEQKPLYDDMRAGIKDHFKGFVNMRDDGALLGPWNPWLREPRFGKPVWELVKAIASNPLLPAPVREVAILVTGSHFRSGYELYAHVLVAEQRGCPTRSSRPSSLDSGRSISPSRKRSPTTWPRRWSAAACCRS